MSTTVLRELVARIGFQLDESGFKKAEADIDAIKASLDQLDKSTGKSAERMSRAGKQMAGASGTAAGAAAGAAGAATRGAAARAPRGADRLASVRVPGAAIGAGAAAAAAGGRRSSARSAAARERTRDARGRFVGGRGRGAGAAAAAAGAGLGGFGALLGGLAIGAAIKEMATLASDANETQNVLKEVFGDAGKNQINAWADGAAEAMGRSTYTLRANAGALGAMIDPMIGNTAKAQEMSQRFAGLAVDLGSFFNATDDDALAALKSGITGEAEPLKKFGVVMNDATLAEFAHTQGLKKKLSAMSNAEKTELRYNFIIAKTKKAEGDAARTSDGFANATKRLQGKLKDAGTDIGQKLLPVAGKLIKFGGDAIAMFTDLAMESSILEVSLGLLTAAFIALKWESIAALAVPLLAFAALALLLDDINQLFTGGDSLLGRWLDTAFGVGTATTFVLGFNEALKYCVELWGQLVETWSLLPSLAGMWDLVTGAAMNFGAAVADKLAEVGEWVTGLITKVENLGRAFARLLGFDVKDVQAPAAGRATGRGLGAGVMTPQQEREARDRELDQQVRGAEAQRKAVAEELAGRNYAAGRGVTAGTKDFGVASLPVPAAPAGSAAPAAPQQVVNNGAVTVNIAAGVGAADSARAAKQAIELERRRTAQAITRTAG